MTERGQPEPREEGGDSQTAQSREDEAMEDSKTERAGQARVPEAGHPVEGEGVGLPEQGAGRAAMEATPPIGTEDQGEPTESTAEQKGMRGGGKEE